MPIEIRELHIRAVVGTESRQPPAGTRSGEDKEQDRESLIAQCVERVMEVLARQSER